MKLTQGKAEKAYAIINMLMERPYTDEDAWALFQIWKKLAPIAEFQGKSRLKLLTKYGAKIEKDGSIYFDVPDGEKEAVLDRFVKEKDQLEQMEVEIDMEPIRLPLLAKFQNCGSYFRTLDGIVEFYKEETEMPELKLEVVKPEELPEEASK